MAGLFSYPKRKLRKMLNAGDYAEALEYAKSIEAKYARDPDFLFIVGSAHYVLGDAAASSSYFERAIEINPYDADSMLLLARLHAYGGKTDEARRLCKRMLEVDAENVEAETLLGELPE